MKLLIAEDDPFFLKLLKQILAPDHELVLARDGNEAWAALQRPYAPQLAILDWVMPGLSGPEICRKVRASTPLSSMYLIIFTAKNNAADIVSGLRAGADDYITKPPVPEELRARVTLGERLVALQDAVQTQSALARQASAREKQLLERIAACPICQTPHGQEDLRGVEAYVSQHFESASHCPRSCTETRPGYLLSTHSLENSHS